MAQASDPPHPPLLDASRLRLTPCRLLWLEPEEARAQKRILRQGRVEPVAGAGSDQGSLHAYRSTRVLVPPEQVRPFLDELVRRRISRQTLPVAVSRGEQSISVTYWGHPLVTKDLDSGRLSVDPRMGGSLVAAGPLQLVRRAWVLTELVRALAEQFGVPEAALTTPWTDESPAANKLATTKQGALLFMQALARLAPQGSLRGSATLVTRALRDHLLDPTVARLARQATRSSFPLAQYNQVLAHRALYQRVEQQTPALLPLLHAYIRQLPLTLREASSPALCEHVSVGFDGLRKALLPSSSKQFWKYLLKVPRSAIKGLAVPAPEHLPDSVRTPSGEPAADARHEALREVIAGLGGLQKFWLLGIPENELSRKKLRDSWERVLVRMPLQQLQQGSAEQRVRLRALLEHLQKEEDYRGALRLLDWLVALGWAQGRPWKTDSPEQLRDLSDEWHLERRGQSSRGAWETQAYATLLAYGVPADLHYDWDTPVSSFETDGVSVRAMTCAKSLWDEHVFMNHCVDGYLEQCLAGGSRLFHLNLTANPRKRSTLELSRNANGWYIRQHEGPCNTDPDEQLAAVASLVLEKSKQQLT